MTTRVGVWLAAFVVSALTVGLMVLFALVGSVYATDSEVIDPQTIDFALLLTAGGIPIAGAIVSSILEVAKRLPLVPGHESVFSMIVDAVLIGIAFSQTGAELNVASAFFTFMAWVNLAGFTSAFYDKALKPSGVAGTLSGESKG